MAMSLCPSGKQKHPSRRQLKRWLRSKGLKGNRVYRCPECSWFHHTSANRATVEWYRDHVRR